MAAEINCTGGRSQRSDWMDSIEVRLGELGGTRSLGLSIYKVPKKLREVDEEAYSPLVVSIGPFHSSTTSRSVLHQTSRNEEDDQRTPVNEDDNQQTPVNEENHQQTRADEGHLQLLQQLVNKHDHLLAMEEDKWRHMRSLLEQPVNKHDHLVSMEENKWWYMLYLLNRTTNTQETLHSCGKAISKVEKDVRGSYAENIKFETNKLMEIILVDGCFILELFLRSWFKDYKKEDPIFQNVWMLPALRHDLALLENQIPFFILENLFKIVVHRLEEKNKPLPPTVTHLALSFFYPDLDINQEAITMLGSKQWQSQETHSSGASGGHYHLLDLLHTNFLLAYPESEKLFQTSGAFCLTLTSYPARDDHLTGKCEMPAQSRRFTKSATKLVEAGIEFKKGEGHFLDITFSNTTGVITIPPLCIDETSKSLLRNLIAFEQCLGSTKQHITSYAILMESLIHSLPDIELLLKKKIIINNLGEVEDVLTLFKNISKEVVSKEFYFGSLCGDVNAYQKSYCHWHRLWALLKVWCRKSYAVLMRDYFSSTWSFISFVAACALLILTIMQTNYAARADRRSH